MLPWTHVALDRMLPWTGASPRPMGVAEFAATLEKVCIKTVESGQMTKDLALLVGKDQAFLTTDQFLDALDDNLKLAMNV